MVLSSGSSLCPSFKQVDAFGPDDLYDDEEVMYITLDLGSIEPTLVPSSSAYRLIGLDTPSPFLQLSGTILKGRHEMLLGTELIFTDGKVSHDNQKRAIIHVANTEQRICFKEARLQPKRTPSEPRYGPGKGKSKILEQGSIEGSGSGVASQILDRVTGKNALRVGAPRGKNTKNKKGQSKGKPDSTNDLESDLEDVNA